MKVKYLSLSAAVVALSFVGTISTAKSEAIAKNYVDNNVGNNFSVKTLEIAPNQPLLLAESNTDELLEQCLKRYQSKEYERALNSCTVEKSAIKISPFFLEVRDSQDALGYLNRGMSRALLLANKQEGIADLQVAANLFREQGKQDEAKKVIEMIKQINS